jgi:hypothetical protein
MSSQQAIGNPQRIHDVEVDVELPNLGHEAHGVRGDGRSPGIHEGPKRWQHRDVALAEVLVVAGCTGQGCPDSTSVSMTRS